MSNRHYIKRYLDRACVQIEQAVNQLDNVADAFGDEIERQKDKGLTPPTTYYKVLDNVVLIVAALDEVEIAIKKLNGSI